MTSLALSRWKIQRENDGTYSLVHPTYSPVLFIVSFDEAHELLKAVEGGGFIAYVQAREKFYEHLHKRIRGIA